MWHDVPVSNACSPLWLVSEWLTGEASEDQDSEGAVNSPAVTANAGSEEEENLTVVTWKSAWELTLEYHRHEFQRWQHSPLKSRKEFSEGVYNPKALVLLLYRRIRSLDDFAGFLYKMRGWPKTPQILCDLSFGTVLINSQQNAVNYQKITCNKVSESFKLELIFENWVVPWGSSLHLGFRWGAATVSSP